MSISPRESSPPKRPRLSLQIKTPSTALTYGRSATALKADIDPSSPTAFNTLSNAYAVAIGNASPRTTKPPTGFPSMTPTSSKPSKPTSLRLETKMGAGSGAYLLPSQHSQTPGPFTIAYPDTPSSELDDSTPTVVRPRLSIVAPTESNFTPPQSAGTTDSAQTRIFTFTANEDRNNFVGSPRTPRRRATIGSQFQAAPYTHPRSLHSILRNSPLPPRSTMTPMTPSRTSLRIATRAGKKVEYNDPLTQTITTNKYIRSHIDLLSEDSPLSTDAESTTPDTLDQTMEYTGDETRDGGSTPGPFEEMRRRMADSGLETPARKKRKQREKKRKWEWTITNTDSVTIQGSEDLEMASASGTGEKTPLTAFTVEKTPNTAVWREVSVTDSEMSEADDPRRLSVDSVSDSDTDRSGDEPRPGSSQSL